MRILVCHNRYRYRGGEEAVVQRDVAMLKASGYEVIEFYRDNADLPNINFFKKGLLFFGSFFSISVYKEITTLIKNVRPDVAHVHNIIPLISPSVYYALKKQGVPIIQTVHNYHYVCANGLFFRNGKVCEKCERGNVLWGLFYQCYKNNVLWSLARVLNLIIHRYILRTYRRLIDVLLVPSRFMTAKLMECGFHRNEIISQPHWQKLDDVEPCYEKEPFALYAGRLSFEKGVDKLIEAWQNMPYELRIAGSGPELKELNDYARMKGITNIKFLGQVNGNEYWSLLRKASCLIVFSQCYENAPNVVIEGFACGTPVVAPFMGGIPEMLEAGGGSVFDLKDYKSFFKAIHQIFEDPDERERLSRAARLNFDDHYAFSVIDEQRRALYERFQR